MELIALLERLKQEEGIEYIKIYFQDKDNYTIKFIKDGVVVKRISKGVRKFDLKEDKAKGVVDKKVNSSHNKELSTKTH